MKELPHVIEAEHRGGHRLELTFADGTTGVVEFERWLDESVFEPLRDVDYFKRFFLDGVTAAWPNGADVAPETLYEEVQADAGA